MINDTITQAILTAAAKPGGFTAQPLGGLTRETIIKRCERLGAEMLLFKARISYHIVRWYSTKEAADNAVAAQHAEAGLRREKTSAAKPRLQDQGGPVQYHPNFKGVQKLEGFERYENRFGAVGAVSFGMQRGRVTR